MKFLLVAVALVHAVSCGNVGVRTSGLLAPAGVTYVDGAYHAGLAAGPVAYSAQPVYQSAAVAAAPAVAVASQQVVQSAPLAYAAPVAKYAAVPTVQHVPGVADVPVTRIDAQPAVIQKTVDVARAAVKTQRYEVRRPAIQKQFYDIEERVVVRPAGSAVVELSEPLSKTQKGPSVIRPTGEAVAVTSSAVTVPETALPTISDSVAPPAPPPSVDINLARSSAPAVLPSVNIARSSFAASAPAAGIARTAFVASTPAPTVGFARSSFVPSAPVGPLPSAPAPVQSISYSAPTQSISYSAPAPAPVQSISYSAPASAPAQAISYSAPASAPAQTISYSAPASAPAQAISYSAPAPVQSVSYSAPAPVQSVSYSAPSVGFSPIKTVSVSAPVQTATISGVSAISSGVSGISSVTAGPSEISVSTPAPVYQQQIVQSTVAPQLSDDSVSIDSADFSLARSSAFSRSGPQTFVASAPAPAPVSVPTPETVFRSAAPARGVPAHASASARGSLLVNYPNPVDLIPQSRFRSAPVYSEGNANSEINHQNQQRLLQLLTARGEVSEVGFGRSGPASYPIDAGQVRARVLSATPAPAYAAPTGERVNTRRVVVSRPIETLQEVEVSEPVTKYERVNVNQPAVVKTASQDVVRVPTSVPVYGKALAPIAEAPVAAYSAGWR